MERDTPSPSGEHSGEWRQIPHSTAMKSFCRKFSFGINLRTLRVAYCGGLFSMIPCGV